MAGSENVLDTWNGSARLPLNSLRQVLVVGIVMVRQHTGDEGSCLEAINLQEPQKIADRLISSSQMFLYIIGIVIYNLCFHPLAAFPGPFLAKTTLVSDIFVLSCRLIVFLMITLPGAIVLANVSYIEWQVPPSN